MSRCSLEAVVGGFIDLDPILNDHPRNFAETIELRWFDDVAVRSVSIAVRDFSRLARGAEHHDRQELRLGVRADFAKQL
jgi:hypothetical protein